MEIGREHPYGSGPRPLAGGYVIVLGRQRCRLYGGK
jgi:hypothetical protein